MCKDIFIQSPKAHEYFFPGVEMLVIRKLQALKILSGKQTWQLKSQIVAKRT